jgi:hypothetical protein
MRLARGLARGDLAHGSSSVDFFPLRGGRVLDLRWAFTLIWVPLIVVPDSSPRAYGGVGICNRTDQIIRAQVQKQASKRSNSRT